MNNEDIKTSPLLTKPPALKGKGPVPAGHISKTVGQSSTAATGHGPFNTDDKTPFDKTRVSQNPRSPDITGVTPQFGDKTSITPPPDTTKVTPMSFAKQSVATSKPAAPTAAAPKQPVQNVTSPAHVPDMIQKLSAKAQMLDKAGRRAEADAVYKELDVEIEKAGLSPKKECFGGGFQVPLILRVRKVKLDEVLRRNPDIHEGALLSFLVSLNEDAAQDLKDKLDKQEYTSISDEVREFIARHVAQQKVKEVVRKKPGGGGYVLYAPNKGKKGAAKSVGNFPTKMGAKRAELARFPPKDPAKLVRLRKEVEKLMKDPKKDDKKKPESKPAVSAKKESLDLLHRKMLAAVIKESLRTYRGKVLKEGLFQEDNDKQGSEWDEYIKHLSKNSLSSDKKYNSLQRNIDKKTQGALQNAFAVIRKAVDKGVKLKNFGVKKSDELGKVYLAFSASMDNVAVEPIYIHIEHGVPKIELTANAKAALVKAEPDTAKLFRAELVTVQERVLDEMDDIQVAIQNRDKYLNKSQSSIDDYVSKLTPLQISILKQLLVKKYRKL